MSKILAIASQKGGVGKTTTTLNLGFSLSRIGGPVLLVDGDPQGGLADASNLKARTSDGLIDVLRGDRKPSDVLMPTRDNTMAVVGVGAKCSGDVEELEQRAEELGRIIRALSAGFDYTIVDVPAGIGRLVMSLLRASDSVIVALNPRPLAVRSLPGLLRLLAELADTGSPVSFEGVVVTMMDHASEVEAKLYQRLRDELPDEGVFDAVIPYDRLFEKASLKAVPVAMLAGASDLARAYMDVAMELKARELRDQTGEVTDDSVVGLF